MYLKLEVYRTDPSLYFGIPCKKGFLAANNALLKIGMLKNPLFNKIFVVIYTR